LAGCAPLSALDLGTIGGGGLAIGRFR
jgi:hypothetical protein